MVDVIMPPTIGAAIGFMTSEPMPDSQRIGARLARTAHTVMSFGRKRWTAPSIAAASTNATFFSIPIGIQGGTGPNSGRFGMLGRNSFPGPAYYDFDFAVIKTTPMAHRSSGLERADLQFRGEFFNVFNVVNMGLPANTIKGSGFGVISKTAGTSRQIQFSLKLIY
jgi:hypothetical protein